MAPFKVALMKTFDKDREANPFIFCLYYYQGFKNALPSTLIDIYFKYSNIKEILLCVQHKTAK